MRVGAGLLILALIGLACAADAPPPELIAVDHPDMDRLASEGAARITELRGRLEDAARGDEQAAIWGELGEIYQAYRLDRIADACLQNARLLQPEQFRWAYASGYVKERRGDLEGAVKAWTKAASLRSGDAATLVRLGDCELRIGRTGDARKRFEAVLWRPDMIAVAEYGLGRVEAAEGAKEAAIAHFHKALELQPGATVVHYPLGIALRDLGRLAEATQYLGAGSGGSLSWPDADADRLEAISPSPQSLMGRAGRALVRKDHDEAIRLYREALRSDPTLNEARRNLALALQRDRRLDEAAKELEEALERAPEDVWILLDLGNIQAARGDTEGALSRYRRAVEVAPGFSRAYFGMANTLMSVGRWQAALAPLDRMLELDPTDRRGRYLQGMALYQSGRKNQGRKRLEALIEDEPWDPVARKGLVEILRLEKRFEEAATLERQGMESATDAGTDRSQS